MAEEKREKYFYGRGRRKEAVAQVRLYEHSKDFVVNDKSATEYFKPPSLVEKVREPFKVLGLKDKFGMTVKVAGGGMNAQAEAVRLGVARALVTLSPDFKSILRKFRLLTRDSRAKERKKYGLKRARRAPQFSKR